MTSPIGRISGDGRDQPNLAGVRDYWLDGSHHRAVDREFAHRVVTCAPQLPYVVRRQRAFLHRVVRYLLDAGVRQFLDLGSGLPTAGNTHEAAHQSDPGARVLYVDYDDWSATVGRRLLSDQAHTGYVDADLRASAQVLESAECQALLDLDEPVAVLMVDVLHHVSDADQPRALIRAYSEALARGSYLALSHLCWDEPLFAASILFDRLYRTPIPSLTFRDAAQVRECLAGLELVEPGVVPIPLWHPEPGENGDRNGERFPGYAALARTP